VTTTDLAAYRAIFRRAPFIADVGFELEGLSPGECRTTLVVQPRHLQHTGQVHAGVMATMADHTAGAAAQTTLAQGQFAITAEFKMSLLRAARGERLSCVARVVKPGRQLVFVESEVFCDERNEPQLVAKLSATMAVVSAAVSS